MELLRIMIIFLVFGGLLGVILVKVYSALNINTTYGWLGGISILVLLFILYRNKLQFSGWYNGKGREKLSKRASYLLFMISIFLLILPLLLNIVLY
ncbi:hypothetical protein SAMN05192533_11784 [Mesobacillus persicus]|uniref:Uncharacterized protein n=1 Tax=Mesobacillus persicus TaxID=930146 RepID=A0A1H8IKX5_9BACI|nr:hypothetical protein [Mesobacillus persicus]SEN69061.1 hypothetical protein SAMN05192533_11784 [Mesobacillus persicus]